MTDEGYTVDVYLYPNPGAGIRIHAVETGLVGKRELVPTVIPFNEYKNVSNLHIGPEGYILFDKPDGTRVESNVPYVVVQTPKTAEGQA